MIVSVRLIVVALLATVSGCSGGGIQGLVPARGKVIYQNKPVEGATISFLNNTGGLPATAITKADGSFELSTSGHNGALPGPYRVTVMKTDAVPDTTGTDLGFSPEGMDLSMEAAAKTAGKKQAKPKELVPAKFTSPTTTTLQYEIKSSDNNFEIKLD